MKRELKFRGWDITNKEILPAITLGEMLDFSFNEINTVEFVQFTGVLDKNGREIYEGDIFRVEEDTSDIEQEDEIFYLVITWVKEWCMFATLEVKEYFSYLNYGIEALDEPMFWTYTLKDTDDRRYFLCGNIFENSELLKVE